MRPLLLLLLVGALSAADLDPYATLDHDALLAWLARGDARSATMPASDPGLAAAEMALVDLALGSELVDARGVGSVWRTRAGELRALRHAAGAAPADFHAAVPDLWVDALDGRTQACLDGLAHYGAAADSPQGRALRCFAISDWRALRGRADLGAHEQVALATALARCRMLQPLCDAHLDLVAPYGAGSLLDDAAGRGHDNLTDRATAGMLRAAVAHAATLATAGDLPADAAPLAAAFIAAATHGATAAAPADVRLAVGAQAAWEDGAVVLAAWRLADAAASAPNVGLRDAAGHWRLGGCGDQASAVRQELACAVYQRQELLRHHQPGDNGRDRLAGPIIAGDHGLLGAGQRWIANGQPADLREFATAIAAEPARPGGGLPPPLLLGWIGGYVVADDIRPSDMTPVSRACMDITRDLARAQDRAEHGHAAGWAGFGTPDIRDPRTQALAAPGLAAAAVADPWSPALCRLTRPKDELRPTILARMPWREDIAASWMEHLAWVGDQEGLAAFGATVAATDPANARVAELYEGALDQLGRHDESVAVAATFAAATAGSDAVAPVDAALALGATRERAHDLDGADQAFAAATDTLQPQGFNALAAFCWRHRRYVEGTAAIDRFTAMSGDQDYPLELIDQITQDPAAPDADAIAALLAMLAHHPAALLANNRTDGLCLLLRRAGGHDRILALRDDTWRGSTNALAFHTGIMLAISGHAEEAAAWMQQVRAHNQYGPGGLAWELVWQDLAAELAGKPARAPAAADLRAASGHGTFAKAMDPAVLLAYLAHDLDRPAAFARAGQDADELTFYLGIDALAHGDQAQARQDLAAVIGRHATWPAWAESGDARRLLAGLDHPAPATAATRAEPVETTRNPGDF
jgi:hypothetical protein